MMAAIGSAIRCERLEEFVVMAFMQLKIAGRGPSYRAASTARCSSTIICLRRCDGKPI
jgi:hypothetical protein